MVKKMKKKQKGKYYIFLVVLLVTGMLSVGFSAFQKELYINDLLMHVRLQRETRVSNISVSKTSGATANTEDYNEKKIYGNITFSNTSSYVLYKVDVTNYGNIKTGLLDITSNTNGINYSLCDSNGNNCTNNVETQICNGASCTLGASKEIYVKVTSSSSGTKEVNLDLNFQPYNDIAYENFHENTTSFKKEVMSTDTYEVTFTSKPEEVEVSGTAQVSYNNNTGKLTLSNIETDLTVLAKYSANSIAEDGFDGSNPNNYVKYNNSLFRMIISENVSDGYGNTEKRTKIIKNDSIGNHQFDAISNNFSSSAIKETLNSEFISSIDSDSKDMIDTVEWLTGMAEYAALIDSEDYTSNSSWLINTQYTINADGSNNVVIVTSSGLSTSLPNVSRATYPVVYLKKDVLIVGGSGSSTDPYILELSGNGLQANPTIISGKSLTVSGSSQTLVTVTNQIGTPYYSLNTQLNSNNYTSGSTSLPTGTSVGTYTIYYYIPAGENYKAKSGTVTASISARTYTITYEKGSNVSSIGKTSDSCTTTGSSLSCSVTLPSITPNTGYESVGWSTTNGDTTGVTGSYTLNSSNSGFTLYANAVVQHNYQNTTTFAYYGTLNDAFATVSSNQTIKVMNDVTETTTATLGSGKTGVKLDLNGKKITLDSKYITNNGELDIYNTSSEDGEITGNLHQVIANNGTLTLNATSSTNKIIIDKTSENSSYGGIRNYKSKSLIVNDNVEVRSNYTAISNYGSATILGGTITGWYGIDNQGAGELNISGNTTQVKGTVGGGIISYGTATITGGTIIGVLAGINFSSGTLTIGTNDSNVSTTSPVVQVVGRPGAYNKYGIDVNTFYEPTFNFYDGVIMSVGGTGYAFNMEPTNVPSGYRVVKETVDGIESAYLEQIRYRATFYYWNGSAIASTTQQCTVTSGTTCTVTVPTVVSSSTGQYGGTYINVSRNISSLSAGSLTLTDDADFYAYYSKAVTIYRPTSATVASSITAYRNEYFTSDSEMSSVISTANNSTTAMTSISGLWSSLTFAGYSTSVNTANITSGLTTVSDSIKSRNENTYYVIGTVNENVTFHYNSNTTSGSFTDATKTQSVTTKYYCSSTAAASVSHGSITTVPSEVSSSVGKYNSLYQGISSSSTGISNVTSFTGGNTYYAYYSSPLTIYYPNTSNGVSNSNTALYRVEYYSSASAMTLVTSTSQTGTTQATSVTLSNIKGTFSGLNASVNNATANALNSTTVKNSCTTTYYAVTTTNENVTFHYNSNTTSGSFTDATTTTSVTSKYYCTSTSAMGTSHGSTTTVPSTVSGSVGKYNSAYKGISSSNNGITNATTFNGGSTYYAYYSSAITVYYPNTSNGISSSNTSLYRNEYYNNSGSNMGTVLASTQTSTSTVATNAISLSNIKGTIVGINNEVNNYNELTTYNPAVLNTNATTMYIITSFDENVTFKYNSNTTNGSFTDASKTTSVSSRYYCASTSAIATKHGTTSTVPTDVSGSVGKYNSPYKGISSSSTGITNVTSFTGGSTYYAYYSQALTIYRPTSETAASSTTAYRNEYYNSAATIASVVSTSNNNTTAMTSISGLWSSVTFDGYSTSVNTSTVTSGLTSVAESIKNRSETTYYVIGTYTKGATTAFYYSKDTSGTVGNATVSANETRNIYCANTTTAATSLKSNGTLTPPTINDEVAPNGTTRVSGWATANSTMSVTSTYNTGTTAYYAIYRKAVTLGIPESETSALRGVVYRNAFINTATPTVGTTKYTTVVASSNTGTSNLTAIPGFWSQATFIGYSTSSATATPDTGLTSLDSIKSTSGSTYYAIGEYSKTVTGTFYYSNSTSGAKTSKTGTGTQERYVFVTSIGGETSDTVVKSNGNYTIPTLTGETAPTGTTSVGWATDPSSMSTITTPTTANTEFYKVYRNQLTIYRPTSATVASSTTAYRNAFYGTGTNYTVKITTTDTGTSDMTAIVGLWSSATFAGYSTSVNTPTITSSLTTIADSIKSRSETTYYVIATANENVTFKYNSNTTSGSFTNATATQAASSTYYCTSNTAATVSHGSTSTVPSAVSSSVGKYNSAYKGVSSSSTGITNVTTFTGGQTYYAYYSSPVTIYYPSNTSTRSSYNYYRNEFYSSTTAMSAVINSSQTSSSNFTFNSSVSGYSLYGFANSANTNTRDYVSVETLAASNKTTSYAILYDNVTATFYYNSDTTVGGFNASTITGSADKYLRCTSSAAEISNSIISVPAVVSNSVGKQNSTYKSVNASASNMGDMNATTANTTYYANYSEPVTNYYYSSGYTSRSLYRNEFFTSSNAIGARLATTNTSTSNYSAAVGPGSSTWDGLSTDLDTSAEYSSIQGAADSDSSILYTVYEFEVSFNIGSNVSAIGDTTGSCSVTTGSTSCNVVLPTITPNAGYTSTGWNTTSGATTGTAAESYYPVGSNNVTLYANATIMYRCPTSRTATNISWGSYSTSRYGSYQDLCESRYGQNSECGKTATGTQTSYHCSNTGGCTFVTGCCSCGYENAGGYRCTDTIYTTNTCTSYRCPNSLTWNYTFGDPQPTMYGDYQSQCVPFTSEPLYQCPTSGTEHYSDYGGKQTARYGSYQSQCVETNEQNTLCGTTPGGTHQELHWNPVCTSGTEISCSLTSLDNCSAGAASCYWCTCRDVIVNTCTLYNCPNTMTYGSPWTFGDWQTSRYGSYQSNCRSNQL